MQECMDSLCPASSNSHLRSFYLNFFLMTWKTLRFYFRMLHSQNMSGGFSSLRRDESKRVTHVKCQCYLFFIKMCISSMTSEGWPWPGLFIRFFHSKFLLIFFYLIIYRCFSLRKIHSCVTPLSQWGFCVI